VLAAGRHQAARDAIDADTPPTGSQHKQLALYLFDAYAQAVAPATAIDNYACGTTRYPPPATPTTRPPLSTRYSTCCPPTPAITRPPR